MPHLAPTSCSTALPWIRRLAALSTLLAISPLLNVWPTQSDAAEHDATPASAISVMPGFHVELLRSAQEGEGSWISLTFDDQGRIILSDDTAGLKRLTLADDPTAITVQPLDGTQSLRHCRGVLYAHQSLYVCETDGQGIHRLQDLDGDGVYEHQQLIVPLVYQSRYGHGANHLRLGPDGMIYVAIGNDVFYPDAVRADSPYLQTHNDWMLPNPHDGVADPRSGFILKISPDGQVRTVLCGGLRNQVDIDFNSDGELFTWDADMEWDVGQPWYRPTRINHIVPGGEYGWRWGSGKWPNWFPDSLPSNLDTGLGSPAGIAFGTASHWPERFRRALYAADWQHGRLLLIEFTESGASYQGDYQVLAEGSPLNICDLEFGPDGALYFITGGRGSQSGLYRVTRSVDQDNASNTPDETVASVVSDTADAAAASARQIRRQLESIPANDADSLPLIWQQLGSDDHWIRFAARLALERQPLATWTGQAETETYPLVQQTALLAWARLADAADQPRILGSLLPQFDKQREARPLSNDESLLTLLRTLQLTLIRQGLPDQPLRQTVVDQLHALPHSDRFPINWLLGELLVALDSPQAVSRLVPLLQTAGTQEEQIQYVKLLVRANSGWTLESRAVVLDWLQQHRRLPGGRLIGTVLLQMRDDFLATLTDQERVTFAQRIESLSLPAGDAEETVIAVNRPLVQTWTLDELVAAIDQIDNSEGDRDAADRYAAGGRYAAEALCLRCHLVGDRGSHVGPDLSNVGKRFDRRALLESILLPSAQIDAKFSNAIYVLEDGQIVTGRAALVTRDGLAVEVDQLTGRTVEIARGDIVQSKLSDVSPMPSGLLDHFTAQEIADLIAYLRQE